MTAVGTSRSRMGRMVSAPSNQVSSRPRQCSMRSVNTCPRSTWPARWISSTARKSTSRFDGHGLDGADEIARPRRHALFLAGDQRHRALAHPRADPVVDLARQQPQRQPDHARFVREHALDRAMGLARVGGPDLRGDARGERGLGEKHWMDLTTEGTEDAEPDERKGSSDLRSGAPCLPTSALSASLW
jgi:hypothetical protein